MAEITHDGLELCVDCLIMVANGEGTKEHAHIMAKRWGYSLVMSCEEDCEGYFSWASCDGCGSTLGGDRHPAIAFDWDGNNDN